MGAKTEITRYMGLKLKKGKEFDPFFLERIPDEGKKYNAVEGFLVAAEVVEKEFDEGPVDQFIITLKDSNGEVDIIDFRHSICGHNLIASLAAADLNLSLKIVVKKRPTPSGEVFARADVYQDGERVAWVDDVENAPRDFDDKKEFYRELFTDKVIDRL